MALETMMVDDGVDYNNDDDKHDGFHADSVMRRGTALI